MRSRDGRLGVATLSTVWAGQWLSLSKRPTRRGHADEPCHVDAERNFQPGADERYGENLRNQESEREGYKKAWHVLIVIPSSEDSAKCCRVTNCRQHLREQRTHATCRNSSKTEAFARLRHTRLPAEYLAQCHDGLAIFACRFD